MIWWDLLLGIIDILEQHRYCLTRVGRSFLRFEGPGSGRGYVDELVLVVGNVDFLILPVLYRILQGISGKQAPRLCPAGLSLL